MRPRPGGDGAGRGQRVLQQPVCGTPGARSALDDLGRSLGRFDAAAQYDAIGRCQQALEREAAELHGRAGQSMRLRLGLSVTAGALLAVTLY